MRYVKYVAVAGALTGLGMLLSGCATNGLEGADAIQELHPVYFPDVVNPVCHAHPVRQGAPDGDLCVNAVFLKCVKLELAARPGTAESVDDASARFVGGAGSTLAGYAMSVGMGDPFWGAAKIILSEFFGTSAAEIKPAQRRAAVAGLHSCMSQGGQKNGFVMELKDGAGGAEMLMEDGTLRKTYALPQSNASTMPAMPLHGASDDRATVPEGS